MAILGASVSLLSFRSVGKRYPDGSRTHVVLEDVSFAIEAGDFVGVWGDRRSGKSTLLRIAAGIEAADDGKVEFEGVDLTRLSGDKRTRALRDDVGFARSEWQTHRNRSVVDHVGFAARADGHVTRKHSRTMARRALKRVGVLECAERRLSALSLGERVRVELAQALVREPRLLLVDEPPPLNNPRDGDDLYELLRSLGEEAGLAVLIASSDTTLVQQTRHMMSLSVGRLQTMVQPEPAEILPFRDRRTADET
jgi:ABC-type ATPase involved in cell division